MIVQHFTAVPQGLIESGSLDLRVDTDSGLIQFSASIVAGVSIFSKTVTESEAVKVSPDLLKSRNVAKGLSLSIGPVSFVVSSVSGESAFGDLSIKTSDLDFTGTVAIDLSGEDVLFTHVIATGTAYGEPATLELTPG
jgi:hypothetical protein